MEDLKWEVEQRQRDIEAQKQQVEMMEQCHHRELDNLQRALQASVHLIATYGHSSKQLVSRARRRMK